MMKQGFLAALLIAVAVGLFSAGRMVWPAQTPEVLGDVTAMQSIVLDVQTIAATGDLAGAKARIADLETAWDAAEPTMRPKNPEAWGRVDAAADAAFTALRSNAPYAATVDVALAALRATLAAPGARNGVAGGVQKIGDIAVTDGAGHPLPCEAMLNQISDATAVTPPTAEKAERVAANVAKATERCNADDDTRSDAFSAAALQNLVTN